MPVMRLDVDAVELEWAAESSFKCRIVPETKLQYPSDVSFSRQSNVICVCWTNNSIGEGGALMMAPLSLLLQIEMDDSDIVRLNFEDGFTLVLVFQDEDAITSFAKALRDNADENEGPKEHGNSQLAFLFQLTVSRERSICRLREAELRLHLTNLDRRMWQRRTGLLISGFEHWKAVAANKVDDLRKRDKARWCLHAQSSADLDLQAWYHDRFHDEIIDLKVRFWLHDLELPEYKLSNKLIANKLTKFEEAALAHILCTPDTTYGDVASHMYVMQSMLGATMFELFQLICSKGISIVKFPRSGSPSKKSFRFSFVEGSIYFTWKGQYGNQGVDLAEVLKVDVGLSTDILKKSGRKDKESLYVSLVCADRTIDLQCANGDEREAVRDVLAALVSNQRAALGFIQGTPALKSV